MRKDPCLLLMYVTSLIFILSVANRYTCSRGRGWAPGMPVCIMLLSYLCMYSQVLLVMSIPQGSECDLNHVLKAKGYVREHVQGL